MEKGPGRLETSNVCIDPASTHIADRQKRQDVHTRNPALTMLALALPDRDCDCEAGLQDF